VWKAFGEAEERPFLFHLAEHADRFGLLVQSTAEPDWQASGVETAPQTKTVDLAQALPGDIFSFSLEANPTASRTYPDGRRRRVSVASNQDLRQTAAHRRGVTLTDADLDRETTLLRWLARKGEQGGFALMGSLDDPDTRICHASPTITHRLYKHPKSKPVTIHSCTFTGHMRVTDAGEFANSRLQGVGRSKGFGFGLLMVKPVTSS
jgi:CRISPR system Cascade subunit CasE